MALNPNDELLGRVERALIAEGHSVKDCCRREGDRVLVRGASRPTQARADELAASLLASPDLLARCAARHGLSPAALRALLGDTAALDDLRAEAGLS